MVGVLLPVGGLVAGVRSEPEAEFHAVAAGGGDDRFEAVGEARGVGVPEFRVGGPVSVPDPLAAGIGGVRRAAFLPAVVDLDDIDPEFRPGLDLLEEEGLVDAGVAGAVAPGVAEEHAVAPGDVLAEPALDRMERAGAAGLAAVVGDAGNRVAVEERTDRALARADAEIDGLGILPGVGKGCEFEEGDAGAIERVFDREDAAADVDGAFIHPQQPLARVDQLAVVVGLVAEGGFDDPEVAWLEAERVVAGPGLARVRSGGVLFYPGGRGVGGVGGGGGRAGAFGDDPGEPGKHPEHAASCVGDSDVDAEAFGSDRGFPGGGGGDFQAGGGVGRRAVSGQPFEPGVFHQERGRDEAVAAGGPAAFELVVADGERGFVPAGVAVLERRFTGVGGSGNEEDAGEGEKREVGDFHGPGDQVGSSSARILSICSMNSQGQRLRWYFRQRMSRRASQISRGTGSIGCQSGSDLRVV